MAEESNADVAAAADVDDMAAAASAADASALALPVKPDGDPGGGLIIMVWPIGLLAPLIALILEVLVGQSSILPRDDGAGLIGNMGMEG